MVNYSLALLYDYSWLKKTKSYMLSPHISTFLLNFTFREWSLGWIIWYSTILLKLLVSFSFTIFTIFILVNVFEDMFNSNMILVGYIDNFWYFYFSLSFDWCWLWLGVWVGRMGAFILCWLSLRTKNVLIIITYVLKISIFCYHYVY